MCIRDRLSPYRSLAFSVISGTLASACETGQSRFTAFAISWNFVSSMPGTVACIVSAIRSITNPAPCLVRRTLACVSTLLLASPALSQANENAIVKHAACAAPRSSSGLVPRRSSSKRLAKPYGYSFSAPVSVLIFPSPFLPWPSQCTLAVFSFIESSLRIENVTNSPSSLRPWPLDLPVGLRQLAGAQLTNRTDYRARHIAHLFLHILVLVERVVAVVVRFVKADVTIKLGGCACGNQSHPFEPVGQVAAVRLDACHVAMHDYAIRPPGQVFRVVPALLLDELRLDDLLTVRRARIGVAAIGADHPVDHEFQRARRLVPVGRREDDYTVRYDPALVDLGHPVVGLAQRMVRITAARPVAQRHRARHATLAWVDAAAVLGGHQAQVEHVRLGTQALHHMARALGEAPGFGDLARTSAIAVSYTHLRAHE